MSWVKRRPSSPPLRSPSEIPIFHSALPPFLAFAAIQSNLDPLPAPLSFSPLPPSLIFLFFFMLFVFILSDVSARVCFSTRRGSGFRTRSRTHRRCSAWIISSRSSTSPPAKTPVSIYIYIYDIMIDGSPFGYDITSLIRYKMIVLRAVDNLMRDIFFVINNSKWMRNGREIRKVENNFTLSTSPCKIV